MTSAEYLLIDVSLERSFVSRDVRIEQEQAIAVIDLLASNTFVPVGHDGGPYRLTIAAADSQLALHVADEHGEHVVTHYLSMTPFRRLIDDYTRICTSYFDAIRHPSPERLEAIDMRRRGIHNEAADLLRTRLSAKLDVDKDTAPRLFTLIYALLLRGADQRLLFP